MSKQIIAKLIKDLDNGEIKNEQTILEEVNQIIEQNPDFYQAYILRGRLHVRQKLYQQAMEDFIKSIQIDSKNYEGYLQRGLLYFEKGLHTDAIRDYNQVIELDPRNAEAYFQKGRTFDFQNQFDDALKDYNQAIELDPKFVKALDARALLFEEQKKIGQFDPFQPILRVTEISKIPFYTNQKILLRTPNSIESREIFPISPIRDIIPLRLLQSSPKCIECCQAICFKREIIHYNHAINPDPNNPLYLSNLGQLYLSQNNPEQAHKYIKQALIILNSTDLNELVSQFNLSFTNIKFIKQTVKLLDEIEKNLKKIKFKMSYQKKQKTITDEDQKDQSQLEEKVKEVLSEPQSADQVKIQQLEDVLKMLLARLDKLERKDFNIIDDKLKFLKQPQNENKRLYYLSFCPRILAYIEACILIDTGHFKVNNNIIINTKLGKMMDKINLGFKIAAPFVESIPVVGSVLEILFQLFDYGLEKHKENKFNEYISNIMAVIKIKVGTQTEREKEFQLASFQSMDEINEQDLNISNLQYYDKVQEIVSIESEKIQKATNEYWQLGIYHQKESKLLREDNDVDLRQIINQGVQFREQKIQKQNQQVDYVKESCYCEIF